MGAQHTVSIPNRRIVVGNLPPERTNPGISIPPQRTTCRQAPGVSVAQETLRASRAEVRRRPGDCNRGRFTPDDASTHRFKVAWVYVTDG